MRLMKLGVMFKAAILVVASVSLGAQAGVELTEEDIDLWMTELSNWGRWGKDDQMGAVNLITPEKRKQAAALVREGVSISLARPLNKEKAIDNTSPLEHVMIRNGVDHPDRSSADSTASLTTAAPTPTLMRSPISITRAGCTTASPRPK